MKDSEHAEEKPAPSGRPATPLVPLAVFAAGMLAVAGIWRAAGEKAALQIRERFDARTDQIETRLRNRLQLLPHLLKGGAGLFVSSERIHPGEWHQYVNSLQFGQDGPGMLGLGYAAYIDPSEKGAFIESVRATTDADYSIFPQGDWKICAPVVFLDPVYPDEPRSPGFDMASDPVLQEALLRALELNDVALSGKLILSDGKQKEPGFIACLPLFERDEQPASATCVKRTARGFVFMPIQVKAFMTGLLDPDCTDLGLSIFDGREQSESARLYTCAHAAKQRPALIRQTTIDFGGHHWVLVFHASPHFEADAAAKRTQVIPVWGGITCLLLSGIVHLFIRSRAQTVALGAMMDQANQTNLELREEIARRQHAEKRLRVRADELDEFNSAMIGRESRVIELKEEVNDLCRALGRDDAYAPVWKINHHQAADEAGREIPS